MVSLYLPLHCHHGADLCHTQLHRGPLIPQRKLKQVMSFYFQTRWWCWVHLMSMQLLSLHLPSFHDVATPKCHPRENLSAETLSCPIPQSMYIYICIQIKTHVTVQKLQSGKSYSGSNPKSKSPLLPTSHHTAWHMHTSHRGWSIYTDIKRESRSSG